MRICENNVKGSSTYLPRSSGISIGAFSVTLPLLFSPMSHYEMTTATLLPTLLFSAAEPLFLSPLLNY